MEAPGPAPVESSATIAPERVDVGIGEQQLNTAMNNLTNEGGLLFGAQSLLGPQHEGLFNLVTEINQAEKDGRHHPESATIDVAGVNGITSRDVSTVNLQLFEAYEAIGSVAPAEGATFEVTGEDGNAKQVGFEEWKAQVDANFEPLKKGAVFTLTSPADGQAATMDYVAWKAAGMPAATVTFEPNKLHPEPLPAESPNPEQPVDLDAMQQEVEQEITFVQELLRGTLVLSSDPEENKRLLGQLVVWFPEVKVGEQLTREAYFRIRGRNNLRFMRVLTSLRDDVSNNKFARETARITRENEAIAGALGGQLDERLIDSEFDPNQQGSLATEEAQRAFLARHEDIERNREVWQKQIEQTTATHWEVTVGGYTVRVPKETAKRVMLGSGIFIGAIFSILLSQMKAAEGQ